MSAADEKVLFGLAPSGTGDGVPLLTVGIPDAAWADLRAGKCSTFDLTKVGLPVKLVIYGAADHDAAKALIEQPMKAQGLAILDLRNRDVGIGRKPDGGA